jgi:hypothetical protein
MDDEENPLAQHREGIAARIREAGPADIVGVVIVRGGAYTVMSDVDMADPRKGAELQALAFQQAAKVTRAVYGIAK